MHCEELQTWFQETAIGSLLHRLLGPKAEEIAEVAADPGPDPGPDPDPAVAPESPKAGEVPEVSEAPENTEAAEASRSGEGGDGGDGGASKAPKDPPSSSSSPQAANAARRSEGKRPGFPSQALRQHMCEGLKQLKQDIKVMLFLSFPADSPFSDPTVESLFQWHYTRRSWVCMDWSALATLLMLCWDIAMNPPYRVLLVLLFYMAFGAGLIVRKLLMFASPSTPNSWRVWHNVLLCTFFFGRCVICQPLLVSLATDGSTQLQAVQVEAFSSVIGLGMTNISMVFMQQMQTVDTLLFCFVNGAVFILWIIFVLQMPLTDALHTAYVGSIVITAVCVRQQRDLEELDRRSFDHQLLNARGALAPPRAVKQNCLGSSCMRDSMVQ